MLVHSRHSAIFAACSGAGSFVTALTAQNPGGSPPPLQDIYIRNAGAIWGATEFSLLALYAAKLAYCRIDGNRETGLLPKSKRVLNRLFKWAGKENMNRVDKTLEAAAWTALAAGNANIAMSGITTLMVVGSAGIAPAMLAGLFVAYGAFGAVTNAARIYGILVREPDNKIGKFMHNHTELLNFGREGMGAVYYLAKGCIDPSTTIYQTAGYLAGQALTMGGYYALHHGRTAHKQAAPTPH